jgi:hypothetical protein
MKMKMKYVGRVGGIFNLQFAIFDSGTGTGTIDHRAPGGRGILDLESGRAGFRHPRTNPPHLPLPRTTTEVPMHRIVRVCLILSITGLILLSGGSASGETKSFTISEAKKNDGIVVAVSEALVREIFESAIGTELDCSADLDSNFEKLLRTLDRDGRGSRATLRDGDTVVRALRRKKSIKFDVSERDREGKIEAVVPWALAECLLGRSTTIDDSIGPIKVKITGEGGGTFEFSVK